jgi:hypothetical protein
VRVSGCLDNPGETKIRRLVTPLIHADRLQQGYISFHTEEFSEIIEEDSRKTLAGDFELGFILSAPVR